MEENLKSQLEVRLAGDPDDKGIVFGKRHLDHLVTEFTVYYNQHRSHMERDHLPLVREEPVEVEKLRLDEIEVKSFVGGLVKGFERKAA